MEPARALQRLRDICSRQEKCPADLITLLKRWDVAPDQYREIIHRLKTENFVNENRYANAFAKDKISFDHWGLTKIRFMLLQKGIEREACESAIGEIDREEYRKMVGRELSRKRKGLKGTPREIWAKLARYGHSRGYEMEVMREFLGSDNPDD